MKKNLNIANLITIFRIILVPIFMVLYLDKTFYYEGFPIYAVMVFLLAFVSDIVDGMIARKSGTITNLGKVLDPLADKLLRLSVLLVFMINKVLPIALFVILLCIDLIAITTSTICYVNKITVQSNIVGKISTIFMFIALFSCFFHNSIKPVDLILVIIAICLAFITLIQYFVKYYLIYKKIK